jgi:hypothetical protein
VIEGLKPQCIASVNSAESEAMLAEDKLMNMKPFRALNTPEME